MRRIRRRASWLFALAILATPSISFADLVQFTDWTTANLGFGTASGNLGGVTVNLSGHPLAAAFLSQQFTGYNSALFTPPLATSDAIEIIGTSPTPTYFITFSRAIRNPVIHLKSLASTLNFGGPTVVKLSGEPTLTVSGSTVSGIADDNPNGHDSNGTIQLQGLFTSLTFTASFAASGDGIDVQIGGAVPAVPSVSPALLGMLAAALGVLGMNSVLIAQRRSA